MASSIFCRREALRVGGGIGVGCDQVRPMKVVIIPAPRLSETLVYVDKFNWEISSVEQQTAEGAKEEGTVLRRDSLSKRKCNT